MASPIAVALSGGADSLYSLTRLQEQGHAVFGLHGIFLTPADAQAAATALAMRERLAEVCGRLGIELHCVDFSDVFSRRVIRPFVESYSRGETPNPCAICNAGIKFGILRQAALKLGAADLATGHYAVLNQEAAIYPPALYEGTDSGKDQSYFLALVPRGALANAVFPLGDSLKSDVLARLERREVIPPQQGESQEVCFVPGDDYRAFVARMAGSLGIDLPGPGPMLLPDNHRLGTHKGLWQYTEGQRKGLGVGWKEPLYVLAKEKQNNALRLGPRAALRVRGCICDTVNVLVPPEFWPEIVLVKTRYRERPKPAKAAIAATEGRVLLRIEFCEPEDAVAAGQIAAVYIDEKNTHTQNAPLRLVAGGVITAAKM